MAGKILLLDSAASISVCGAESRSDGWVYASILLLGSKQTLYAATTQGLKSCWQIRAPDWWERAACQLTNHLIKEVLRGLHWQAVFLLRSRQALPSFSPIAPIHKQFHIEPLRSPSRQSKQEVVVSKCSLPATSTSLLLLQFVPSQAEVSAIAFQSGLANASVFWFPFFLFCLPLAIYSISSWFAKERSGAHYVPGCSLCVFGKGKRNRLRRLSKRMPVLPTTESIV